MAIFQGKPNLGVMVSNYIPAAGEVPSLHFDKNGYYETKNPFMIKRLRRKFKEVAAREPQGLNAPTPPATGLTCKKCGASGFANNGFLLAHTRKFHPKVEVK